MMKEIKAYIRPQFVDSVVEALEQAGAQDLTVIRVDAFGPLAGVSGEIGVVMLLYLDLAYEQWKREGRLRTTADLRDAIYQGAVKRLRPTAMTASVIIAGLLPILWSNGTGADVMKRIATPMVGGVITATLMALLIYPAAFYLWRSKSLPQSSHRGGD